MYVNKSLYMHSVAPQITDNLDFSQAVLFHHLENCTVERNNKPQEAQFHSLVARVSPSLGFLILQKEQSLNKLCFRYFKPL